MGLEICGKKRVVRLTYKQQEVLNDVLYEIEEDREYEGEDLKALEELKDMFTYDNVIRFREYLEEESLGGD